jgi:hypothetical protein
VKIGELKWSALTYRSQQEKSARVSADEGASQQNLQDRWCLTRAHYENNSTKSPRFALAAMRSPAGPGRDKDGLDCFRELIRCGPPDGRRDQPNE